MSIRARASGLARRTGRLLAPDATAARATGTAAIMAQRAARPAFRHLWDAEVSVYSQWGEDGILDFLLDFLDIAKPEAVEFGAGNFTECNTRFLAEYRCASVLAVDARDDLVPTVAALAVNWRTTVLARRGWITPETAPLLLKEAQAAFGGVDLVSIDIDGNDYWVLESLDLADVAVVVVEYNSVFGALHPVSVPRDDAFDRTQAHYSWLYYGASLPAFIALLRGRGFAFLGSNRAGSNAFFVRDNLLDSFPLPIPDPKDVGQYTDWRGRESRDRAGNLDLLTGRERLEVMADLPLVDTVTGATLSVRAVHAEV
jgi:hypothetical protein